MLAGKRVKSRCQISRNVDIAKLQGLIPFIDFQQPLQVFRRSRIDPLTQQPAMGGVDVTGRERNIEKPLTSFEKLVEAMDVLGRVDHPEQFDIVVLEHDRVIAGAPPDMPPARRQRETKPGETLPCPLQIGHPDQGVIDPRDRAIGHRYIIVRHDTQLPKGPRTSQNLRRQSLSIL